MVSLSVFLCILLCLFLFGRLQTGWSVHTYQTERQRKSQVLEKQELDIILSVIHRAEQLDQLEQHRIGYDRT